MVPQPSALRLHAIPRTVRITGASLGELAERLTERRLAEARERGRSEGALEVANSAAAALDHALELLEAERSRTEEQVPARAVELALVIARRLLRAEIDAERYDIERIVRETLAASGVDRGSCVVHLNPRDLERLEGVRFRAGTRLEADPAVDRGDVHVTTAQGLFVHEVDSLLEAIDARLREELA